MARRYYSSTAARTTLASGVNDSTTTFTVAAVSGWPSSFPYTLIIDQDTINEEIVEVTARSGTTLTVTRGVDGTTGVAHDAGAAVNHGVSARDFDEPNAFINGTDFVSTDGGSTVTASGASVVPLVLKGASGQTANLLTVEDSAGTDLVVVDEAGKVGIGVTDPSNQLEVDGTIRAVSSTQGAGVQARGDGQAANISAARFSSDTTPADFQLYKYRGSIASPVVVNNADVLGRLRYYGYDGSNLREAARIEAAVEGTPGASDMPGRLVFFTTADDAASPSERMRINNAGAVLIGTTTVGSASTGDLVVNGGVFLGGSAAANELDDYEEGTWTPELTYETPGTLSVTYSQQSASYVKVGSLVFIRGEMFLSAFTKGTASGEIRIDGLPFTSNSRSFISWGAQFTPLTATDGHYPAALINSSTAYVSWINVTNNGDYGTTDPDGNSRIFVSGCYTTNA